MQDLKVVIITINYNQSKMTLECIDSILKSSYNNFKLIVIDNGSKLEDYKYLANNISEKVVVERIERNCGYVGGVNQGFLKGESYNPDYYLIMNNDTIIDDKAVKYFVDTGNRYKQNAIISGKTYHFDKIDIIQHTGSFFSDRRYLKEVYPCKNEKDIGQCDQEEERDMLDDIFWLIPKKIVQDIGNYSNNFFLYGEQADYALRAVKKGYKLIYTPNAKIWHKGSMTTGEGNRFSPVVNFWRKKSSVIYLFRNTDKKYFYFQLLKTFPKLVIKNIFNFLKLRKSNDKKSEYAALIGTLYGLKWVINKRPDDGYNPFLK